MPELTQELMLELLTKMNEHIDTLDASLDEIRSEMHCMRDTMTTMEQEIHSIYGVLGRHEGRLERIEKRLVLRELAEAQTRF
jgi:hypothetical protein